MVPSVSFRFVARRKKWEIWENWKLTLLYFSSEINNWDKNQPLLARIPNKTDILDFFPLDRLDLSLSICRSWAAAGRFQWFCFDFVVKMIFSRVIIMSPRTLIIIISLISDIVNNLINGKPSPPISQLARQFYYFKILKLIFKFFLMHTRNLILKPVASLRRLEKIEIEKDYQVESWWAEAELK